MTYQIPDEIDYKDNSYALSEEYKIFDANEYSFKAHSECTALWRGYRCNYKVEKDQLFLDELQITHLDHELKIYPHMQPPNLNGIIAVKAPFNKNFGRWYYNNINLALKYYGQLIICNEDSTYELSFNKGKLIKETHLPNR